MGSNSHRCAAILCLLLAGCTPEGLESKAQWDAACIRQGGEPLWIKVNNGMTYLCLSTDAIIKVKP